MKFYSAIHKITSKLLIATLFVIITSTGYAYAADTDAFIIRVKTDNTCAGGCNSTSYTVQAASTVGYAVDCNYNGTSFATTTAGLTTTYTCSYGTPGTYDIAVKSPAMTFAINGSTVTRQKILQVRQWGTTAWTSFDSLLNGANNVNIIATDIPNLSNVTSMVYAFKDAVSLTGNATMGSWNTSNVTSMKGMFLGATLFNQDIGSWDTRRVIDFESAFGSAVNFNQNLGAWNVASGTIFTSMFGNATVFNNGGSSSINNWNMSNANTLQGMFDLAKAFNQPIGNWNISKVTNINFMFRDAWAFNQPLNSWNTSNVQQLRYTFNNARAFNQPIGNWNTSKVNDSNRAFMGAWVFNQDIGAWNMASNTNMSFMFAGATAFNNASSSSIGAWNTSNVTTMQTMFNSATNFNQNIGAWNLSKTTDIAYMFLYASKFNNDGSPDINNWNTSNVTSMVSTFDGASAFNQPLNSWNTAKVTSMRSMFYAAINFNQDISSWTTSAVTSMQNMFSNASKFDQNLGSWVVKQVTNLSGMLNNTKLSIANYDSTIIAWETQKPLSATSGLGAAGLKYCNSVTQRTALQVSGLSFAGDTLGCASEVLAYNGNGATSGTVPSIATGTVGSTVTVAGQGTLVKTGNTFSNWNTSPLGSGTNYATSSTFTFVTGTTTLYAKWIPNTYQVLFDINTGTGGVMANQNFTYGVASNLNTNNFTKTNSTFAGWNTASNGSGVNYINGQSVSNLSATNGGVVTLYAQWATAPVITNVTATNANGYYKSGSTVTLTVTFDQVVNVVGTPQIALNTGGIATYSSGSGTAVLEFVYTVGAGENTGDLEYSSTTALSLNGGTIRNAGLIDAVLTLPSVGQTGSLSTNKNIVIDTVAPTAPSVNADITGGFSLTSPNITFTSSDTNFSHFFISINGGATSTVTSPYNPTLGVAASYNVVVTAVDMAGNMTVASILYPPTVNINAPTKYFNNTVTDSTVTITAPVGSTLDSLTISGTNIGDVSTGGLTCSLVLPAVIPAGGITCSGFVVNNTATVTAIATLSVGDGGAVGQAVMLYEKDTVSPTTTISSTTTSPTISSMFGVIVKFLKAMTGADAFDNSDLSIINGSSGGACSTLDYITFNCPITATLIGTTTISVLANKAQDKFGNFNLISNILEMIYSPAPTITNITSTSTKSSYKAGDTVFISVTFDQIINASGTPTIDLLNGGVANYVSGSGSSTLVFAYTVTGGQDISDLDYAGPNALNLAGGLLNNAYGTPSLLTLPSSGASSSLGFNKDIVIDTVSPIAPVLTLPTSGSSFYSGNLFTGTCEPNATVNISHANIAPNPTQISCGPGGNYSGPVVFSVGTTTTNILITQTDVAGNVSPTTTLATLNVYTGPQVLNVTSPNADTSYGAGSVITITIEFDQAVNVTGTPLLTLNSGGSATYVSGSGSTLLTFTYTITGGENSADLDYPNINSLTLNGGTIKNPANIDANLTLPLSGIQGILGVNKNITIDTLTPSNPSFTSHTNNGTSNLSTTLAGLCEANTALLLTHADIVGSPIISTCDGTGSYSIPVTFTSTGLKSSIKIKQTDQAGNTSPETAINLTVVSTLGGIVAPVSVPVSSGGGSSLVTQFVTQIKDTVSNLLNTKPATQAVTTNPNLIGGAEPNVPAEFSNYVCVRYLKEYIRPGAKNNPEEVKKLQSFLNEYENEKLVVDGVYKQADIDAVKRFQAKYLDQIMLPWGVTEPTGIVFRTTVAKINLLSCAKQVGCPYFDTYMKSGDNTIEAVKVQDFLNIISAPTSGYPTNGIALEKSFNLQTVKKVKEFQGFYKDIVLKPWDLTTPTGRWYQTTRHAANKLMNCSEGEIKLDNGLKVR